MYISGKDSAGVCNDIRLSTRNVASIFVFDSNRDRSVSGQIVSSFNVSVVKASLSTNFREMRLTGEPESSRHRALAFTDLPSILTNTVGRKVTLFRLISAEREAALEVEGVGSAILVGLPWELRAAMDTGDADSDLELGRFLLAFSRRCESECRSVW